jgi:ribose 5-phosphate isomerase
MAVTQRAINSFVKNDTAPAFLTDDGAYRIDMKTGILTEPKASQRDIRGAVFSVVEGCLHMSLGQESVVLGVVPGRVRKEARDWTAKINALLAATLDVV